MPAWRSSTEPIAWTLTSGWPLSESARRYSGASRRAWSPLGAGRRAGLACSAGVGADAAAEAGAGADADADAAAAAGAWAHAPQAATEPSAATPRRRQRRIVAWNQGERERSGVTRPAALRRAGGL